MAKLIKVKSAYDDGRVALWERHPDHPAGEIFVASDKIPVEVAETPLVLRKMSDRMLVRAETKAEIEAKARAEAKAEAKRASSK